MVKLHVSHRADHVFARTFAIYAGAVGLLTGLTALLLSYNWASPVWTVRFNQLGQIDGPYLGLLFESIRLFLIVVLGLTTVCWGFPEEVAALLRFRMPPKRRERGDDGRFIERRPRRPGSWNKRIIGFRLLLLIVVVSLCVWKVGEVFSRDAQGPSARLLEWGLIPDTTASNTDEQAKAAAPDTVAAIRDRELTFAQLRNHYRSIQNTYVLYLPCLLVSYGLIIPLVFIIPLYSATCTDRQKLNLFQLYRLLAGQESADEIHAGLKQIRIRCFQASQRYLYLCAALGIVFVYIQVDPTLAADTRNVLRYVFYFLVGGSALAVLKLWGHYYGAWQLTLSHLVEHCEPTDRIQAELSPLKFGKELLMQTPQGIVATALISPAFQEMIGRMTGA